MAAAVISMSMLGDFGPQVQLPLASPFSRLKLSRVCLAFQYMQWTAHVSVSLIKI